MLHYDHGVAAVAQPLEGRDEPLVVARVESDSRLVEDIEDSGEPRADLGREADALHLPAGERRGGAVEGEVVESDVEQELEPAHDLRDDVLEAAEAVRVD